MALGSARMRSSPRSARAGWARSIARRDTNLKREVAIKVLPDAFAHDAERLARFEREAKSLAALNHPNIAHDLRPRRSGRHPCARDGAGRGADARRPHRAGPDSARRSAADREADRRSARSRARAGHHPSRPEAGEHQAAAGRHGEGARLRPGEGARADAAGASTVRQSPTITRPR